CVSGGLKNIGSNVADLELLAFGCGVVDLDSARGRTADPCGLHIQHLQQSKIILIEQNWSSGCGFELHGATHVVYVRVSYNNVFQREPRLTKNIQDFIYLVSGIDDHGLVRLLVADDGAVTLQQADGKNFVEHKSGYKRLATAASLAKSYFFCA